MAIKGKNRGKAKAKQVTRPPRPSYTPVPAPFVARRWVQVTAAFVLGVSFIVFVAWIQRGLRNQSDDREARRRQAAERTAMQTYQGKLDPILAQVGEAQGSASAAPFPRFAETVSAFEDGKASEDELSATADATDATATEAADALQGIDAAAIVRDTGASRSFASAVTDSWSRFEKAVRAYGEAAAVLRMAGGASGKQQRDLLETAAELEQIAKELFNAGYVSYTEAQVEAGTFQPPTQGQPPIPVPGS